MNPLNSNELFSLELMNPSAIKDDNKYLVTFELHKPDWDKFMDAETAGMVLRIQGRVVPSILEEDKLKDGPISKEARMMCKAGIWDEYAALTHETNMFASGETNIDGTISYANLKDMIYQVCNITSRAELDYNVAAAWKFNNLKSKLYCWDEAKKNEILKVNESVWDTTT